MDIERVMRYLAQDRQAGDWNAPGHEVRITQGDSGAYMADMVGLDEMGEKDEDIATGYGTTIEQALRDLNDALIDRDAREEA